VLAEVDGYPGFVSMQDLDLGFDFRDETPEAFARDMVQALETARSVHNDLYQQVYKYFMDRRHEKFVGNPTHIIAEIMEFLSHIAVACCLIARSRMQARVGQTSSATRKKQLADENYQSAIRHLNRVSLDMLKITNEIILTNGTMDKTDVAALLRLRHEFCPRKFGPDKLAAYHVLTTRMVGKYATA
jgi:hypothetical protein